MKIYNKSYFIVGIVWFSIIIFHLLSSTPIEWWRFLIIIAIAFNFIYRSLSKTENQKQEIITKYYKETANYLYGPYVGIKLNLPIIIILTYFPIALILQVIFKIWLPIWLHYTVILLVFITVFYSIGISNKIKTEIESKHNTQGET